MGLKMDKKYITITVKNDDGARLEQKVDWDSSSWDWADVFKVIMLWLTFTPESIKEVIRGEYDEEET